MPATSSSSYASNEDVTMFLAADYNKLYSLHPVMSTQQSYGGLCAGAGANPAAKAGIQGVGF